MEALHWFLSNILNIAYSPTVTVIEDLSSLVSVFGSSILEELMDLFTEYSFLLGRALTYETNDAVEGAPKIKTAESLSQKVSVIATLSTLKYIFSNLIINIFKDINQLETVIDGHMASVSDICSRLQAQLCKQFIHSIMSNEASCIKDHASLSSKEEEQPACQDDVLKQSHGNLLLNTLSYPNPTMHNDVVMYYLMSKQKIRRWFAIPKHNLPCISENQRQERNHDIGYLDQI
ncbi:hypothetical protein R6Q57_009814 [Mikania cordata]